MLGAQLNEAVERVMDSQDCIDQLRRSSVGLGATSKLLSSDSDNIEADEDGEFNENQDYASDQIGSVMRGVHKNYTGISEEKLEKTSLKLLSLPSPRTPSREIPLSPNHPLMLGKPPPTPGAGMGTPGGLNMFNITEDHAREEEGKSEDEEDDEEMDQASLDPRGVPFGSEWGGFQTVSTPLAAKKSYDRIIEIPKVNLLFQVLLPLICSLYFPDIGREMAIFHH